MDGVFVELREGPEPGGSESRSDGVGVGAEGVSATALGAQLWHLSDSRGPRLSGFAFQEDPQRAPRTGRDRPLLNEGVHARRKEEREGEGGGWMRIDGNTGGWMDRQTGGG